MTPIRPRNMPAYPSQRVIAQSLVLRKQTLLNNILFIEKSLINRDFHDFPNLVRHRIELKEINKTLSGEVMKNYISGISRP